MRFYRRFLVWAKQVVSEDEVASRLAKVEHALEMVAVQEPMSRVNEKNADALAKVAGSLQDVENYVVLVGSLIIVKYTDGDGKPRACARTLSVAEVRSFERDERLLRSPADAFKHLEQLSSDGTHNESNPS
jgi:hypothetical protein